MKTREQCDTASLQAVGLGSDRCARVMHLAFSQLLAFSRKQIVILSCAQIVGIASDRLQFFLLCNSMC